MSESQPLLSSNSSPNPGSEDDVDLARASATSSVDESIDTTPMKNAVARRAASRGGSLSFSKKDAASLKSSVRFDDDDGTTGSKQHQSPNSSPSASRSYGTGDDTTPLFWSMHIAKKGGRRWLRRAKTSSITGLGDGNIQESASIPGLDAISSSINLAHTTNNGVKYQPLELASGSVQRKKREHHTRIGAKLSQLFHPDEIHTIMGHDDKTGSTGHHTVFINSDADELNTSSTSVTSSSTSSPTNRFRNFSRLSSGFNTPTSASSCPPSPSSTSSYTQSSWACTRWICLRFHANKQHIFEQLTDPAGEYRRIWLLLIFLFLMYNAISVPLRLAFSDIWLDIHTVVGLTCFDYIGDLFFLLDVSLYFYTPYLNQGMLERDTKEIQSHYLRGWFVPDLISSFPLDLIFIHNGLRAALPWRLTRLFRFAKYDQYFQVWEQYSTRYPQFIRFFKLLLSILLILHWLACLWFWCGYYYGFGATIWLPAAGIDDASLSSQYIFAFWWATNIVTQVGGDPGLPTNDIERALDLSIAFLSVFVVAVVIGNVNELVSELNADEGRLREKLQTLNHFMVTRRLPEPLQARIRSYYLKIWIRRGGVDDAAIMEELPTSLRTEISLVMNKDILGKVAIFASSSTGFIHSLVGHLKLQTYGPGEMIVREGDIGSEMYFVSRGQVNVLKGDKVVGTITAGGVFGEIAVLQESSQRTASIQAINYCDLFVLTHEDMMTLFKSFPAEKQIILNVAETRKAKDLLTKVLNDDKLLKREREAGFSKDPKLVAQLIDLFKPIAMGAGALHQEHEHYQSESTNNISNSNDTDSNNGENIDGDSKSNSITNNNNNSATNNLLRESGLIEGENGELIDLEELENRGLVFGPFQPADTLYFIGKGAVDILPNLNHPSPMLKDLNSAITSSPGSLLEEDEQKVICRLSEGSFFGCITDGDYQVSAVIAKEYRCDTIIFAFTSADLPALQSYYENIQNPKDKQRTRRSLTALFTRYRTEDDYKNSVLPLSAPSSNLASVRTTPTQKSLHQLIRTVSKTARMSRRNSQSFGNGEMPPLQLAAGATMTATSKITTQQDITTSNKRTSTTSVQEEKSDHPDETADVSQSRLPSPASTSRATSTSGVSTPTIITISEASEAEQKRQTTSAVNPPTSDTTVANPTAAIVSPRSSGTAPSIGSPNYYSPLASTHSLTQEKLLNAAATADKENNVINLDNRRPRNMSRLTATESEEATDTSAITDTAGRQRRSNSFSVLPKGTTAESHLSPAEPLSATSTTEASGRDRRPSHINVSHGGAAPFAFLLKMNQSAASHTATAATSPRGSSSSPHPQPPRSGSVSPHPERELPSPLTPSTTGQKITVPNSPSLHGQAYRGSIASGSSTAAIPSTRMIFLEKALNDLTNDQLLLLCNKATLKLYSRLHNTMTA